MCDHVKPPMLLPLLTAVIVLLYRCCGVLLHMLLYLCSVPW